jgi:hypothetical protein
MLVGTQRVRPQRILLLREGDSHWKRDGSNVLRTYNSVRIGI